MAENRRFRRPTIGSITKWRVLNGNRQHDGPDQGRWADGVLRWATRPTGIRQRRGAGVSSDKAKTPHIQLASQIDDYTHINPRPPAKSRSPQPSTRETRATDSLTAEAMSVATGKKIAVSPDRWRSPRSNRPPPPSARHRQQNFVNRDDRHPDHAKRHERPPGRLPSTLPNTKPNQRNWAARPGVGSLLQPRPTGSGGLHAGSDLDRRLFPPTNRHTVGINHRGKHQLQRPNEKVGHSLATINGALIAARLPPTPAATVPSLKSSDASGDSLDPSSVTLEAWANWPRTRPAAGRPKIFLPKHRSDRRRPPRAARPRWNGGPSRCRAIE